MYFVINFWSFYYIFVIKLELDYGVGFDVWGLFGWGFVGNLWVGVVWFL